jgi:uncharacterized membrane protein
MHEINEILEWLAVAVDLTGATIMVWAFVEAVVGLVRGSIRADDARSRIRNMQVVRCGLGVKLVFALELMIISDLFVTIISRSIDDLILVGGLVVIRTVIGYFLNKEIQEVGAELAQADDISIPNN